MLKQELQKLLAERGLTDEQVIELSQEINDLILDYYREDTTDSNNNQEQD